MITQVYNLADLKREMAEIIEEVDHKNLDLDVPYFRLISNIWMSWIFSIDLMALWAPRKILQSFSMTDSQPKWPTPGCSRKWLFARQIRTASLILVIHYNWELDLIFFCLKIYLLWFSLSNHIENYHILIRPLSIF